MAKHKMYRWRRDFSRYLRNVKNYQQKTTKKYKKVLTLKINRGIILNVPSNERKKDRNKLVK